MTKLHPFEDPLRRCLKLEEWPEADRLAWDAALAPGDLLDGTMGAGHHWCSATREKYRKGSHGSAVQALKRELFEPDFERSTEMTRLFEERWTYYTSGSNG